MKLIYATLIFLALATLAHAQAITDILLSVAGDTFAVGSTVTLYGEQ